jgi:HAD superfamily hydrolase (TIGR01450 family)
VPLTPTAQRYDHVLLDLDGTVWVGDAPVDGATEAVAALREAGKGIVFLTNDVRHTPEDHVLKLWRLGFRASLDEVVTVGAALQYLLADRRQGGAAFVIGAQAVVDHVADGGMRVVNNTEFATRADLVVVAGHERFDYGELRIATQALGRGAELIGTSRDATYPMPDGPWPGTGALLAAVETACGRSADLVVGKPGPGMYDVVRERVGAGRLLAVGDRLDSDIAGARAAGIDSALVLTGAESAAPKPDAPLVPTHVAPSLAALVLG